MTNQASPFYTIEFWYGSKASQRFFTSTGADPKPFKKHKKSLLHLKPRKNKLYTLAAAR